MKNLIIFLSILIIGCTNANHKKNNDKVLLALILINQNSGGTTLKITGQVASSSNVRSSNSKAITIPAGTSLVAFGTDGSTKRTTVDSTGNFEVTVNKGNFYTLVFHNGPTVVGVYKIQSSDADAIPAENYTSNSMDLGSVSAITSGSNTFVTSQNPVDSSVSQNTSLTQEQLAYIGSMDDNLAYLKSLDVDGNGVVDLDETNKKATFTVDNRWTGAYNNGLDISSKVINQFPDLMTTVVNQTFEKFIYLSLSGGFSTLTTPVLTHPAYKNSSGTSITQTTITNIWSDLGNTNYGFTILRTADKSSIVKGDYTYTSGSNTFKISGMDVGNAISYEGKNFANFRINTTDGQVTSISYVWKKTKSTGVVDSSLTELEFLYGKKALASVQCATAYSLPIPTAFKCNVPVTSLSGTIDISNCTITGTLTASSFKFCSTTSKDRFGNASGFNLL